MSRFHLVYRSSPGDNGKARPAYFSKDVALATFLKAAGRVSTSSIHFVNDGHLPHDRLLVMGQVGELETLPGVGNARSYRAALSLTDRLSWSDDDIVYFSEDDYFYIADAFVALLRAAEDLPEVDFFTLYDHPDYYNLPVHRRYRPSRERRTIGAIHWRPVRSTCMSFAARVGALRRNAWAHLLASNGSYPMDYDLWSLQTRAAGFRLLGSMVEPWSLKDIELLKLVVRRKRHPVLVAPTPTLASHMQEPFLAPGVDWSLLASPGRSTLPRERMTGSNDQSIGLRVARARRTGLPRKRGSS